MRWLMVALTLSALVTNARADELTPEESAIQIHGFVSQGALLTSDNNFLANTERGSFEFSEGAITITKQLDSKLRVGFQLFARDLGPLGNYSAKFDWFNLDYHWRDWLGVRAGRVKIPWGLYNDSADVDAAHAVVLLPQSIYSIANRDFLLAQTGVEIYGYRRIGALGALDYRAFAGTVYLQLPATPAVMYSNEDVPYIVGTRVAWETPAPGLRVVGSVYGAELSADAVQPGVPFTLHPVQQSKGVMASLEYTADALVVAAEYSRGHSEVTVPLPGMPPSVSAVTAEGGYLMASYRLAPWIQPAMYYSFSYPNVGNRDGSAQHSHDSAASLRFDITPNWILKIEGHAVRGTAGVTEAMNPDGRSNRWYLLAAKTTVYF